MSAKFPEVLRKEATASSWRYNRIDDSRRSFQCRSLQLASKSKTELTITSRVRSLPCFRPLTEHLGALSTRTVTAHSSFSPRRSWLSPLPGGVPHDRQPNHARDLRDRTDGARR